MPIRHRVKKFNLFAKTHGQDRYDVGNTNAIDDYFDNKQSTRLGATFQISRKKNEFIEK